MARRRPLFVTVCAALLVLGPIGGAVLGSTPASATTTTSCPTAANETGASFGGKNFAGCNFTDFNFTSANLSGANLTGATFTGATLSSANFSGSNLSKALLSPVTATSTNFQGANLAGDNLANFNGNGATLQGDNLSSTNFSNGALANVNFQGANLSSANLSNAVAVGASFQGDNLSSANLGGATVNGDNFQGANLSSANLVKTSATGALFQGDNLAKVDFNSGNLASANVQGANSAGSTCVGTNLYGLVGTLSCSGGISVQPPGTPTKVTATAGVGQATVSFTAPSSGGAPTSYVVTSSPGGLTATGTSSPITITGLTNGTAYTFTVTAVDADGSGPASSPSAAVTPKAVTVPGAPTINSVSAGNGSAAVSFSAPSNNGGATITGYTVTATPTGGGTPITASGSSSPITVAGLTNGTAYTFTVAATNSAGTGSASAPSASSTPTGPPASPSITAVTTGSASATVAFTPGSNGGLAVSKYTVTATPVGGGTPITASGSGSPVTVSGLTNGTAYTFTITATNSAGTSAPSTPSSPSAPTGVPGAPSVTAVTIGDGTATVAFSPPTSTGGLPVTGYTVTATPAGGGTPITASGTTSPITLPGLSDGTAYTFTVAATNANGTGVASAPSQPATPQGAPPVPVVTGVTLSGTSASIAFTEDTSGTGDAVITYAVTSNPAGITADCSSSPCVVSGLVLGQSYTFSLTASDAYGTSDASGASSPVTATAVPAATSITEVTASSDGDASVSFTTLTDNSSAAGGLPITGYTVTARPGGESATCSSSPCVVSGLTNGDGYAFTVVASNADGSGAASPPSTTTTVPAAAPGAPSILAVTPTDSSATITVAPPASDNGAAVTSYTVTAEPGNETGTATAAANGNTSVTVSGLTNGQSYTFTATATNSAGAGSASAPTASVTPSTVPGAPSITSLTAEEGAVSVAFTPPSDDGGAAITGYTVTATPAGGGSPVTASGTSSPITVSGLTNGEGYTFTIVATNGDGDSAASPVAPATGSVAPGTVPGMPTGLEVTPEDGAASLSFAPPSDDGGLPVSSYVVVISPGGATASCNSSPCTITGLTDGESYSFTIAAVNTVGTGTASSASTPVIPVGPPSAPAITTVSAGGQSATVSFDAPTSDGGLAVMSYTVTSSPDGITAACSDSPCTVTGLTDGTAYTFTVTATNSVGTSVSSAPSTTPVTPLDPPSAPSVGALSYANGIATVEVDAPSDDGGAPVASYTVTSVPGGITATCLPSGASTPCQVTGLTDGVTYTFTVTATNAAGTSAASAASASSLTPTDPPGAPTITSAASNDGSITVAFTSSTNTGGLPVTAYTVTASPGGLTASCSSSPCTVDGLTNGQNYTFTVTATNAAGTSAPSIASNPIEPTGVPGAAVITSVVPGDGSATVYFTLPSDGGLPVSNYTVTTTDGTVTVSGTSSPITVNGLSDGIQYQLIVTANNIAGTGAPSLPSQPFTPTGPPSSPAFVTATPGNQQATVNWATPVKTGGLPISYTITSTPASGTYTTTDTQYIVTGLTNGVSYAFTVTATNALGSSPATSGAVIPFGPAGAPSISSVGVGNSSLKVTITPPSDDGGSAISQYNVIINPGGLTLTSTSPSFTLTGLTNGVQYTLQAYVTTAAGPGAVSASVNGTPGTVPGQPTITSVTLDSSETATVNVDPTTNNGGYPITSWTVSISPTVGGGDVTATSLPITVPGLDPSTTYTFTVTATNALGNSIASVPYVLQSSSSSTLIEYTGTYGTVIDPVTGDLINADFSESDPITYATVIPAPATPPTSIAFFQFPTYLLTQDPISGAYTTFEGTTVDIATGQEYDAYGNPVVGSYFDPTNAYFVTTAGTLVSVLDPSTQLDPVTLAPVSTAPYTIVPTPPAFQVNNGPAAFQA